MIKMKKDEEFTVNNLKVKIFDNRKEMGVTAAEDVAERIKKLLSEKEMLNMIFAAAPSQNEFLEALAMERGIPWEKINAFHMDEYIGLREDHPQRFGNFLKERIFEKVGFHKVYFLNTNGQTPEKSCKSYTDLLLHFPPDIVCMGIGENTHVAFNDPHVADFKDPALVKLVLLDEISRQQQVNDRCFETIDEVPELAITLTVPALMQAQYIYCIVPGANKARAVSHTLHDNISEKYPSTSLRRHPHAILYLDKDSASQLNKEKVHASN